MDDEGVLGVLGQIIHALVDAKAKDRPGSRGR